MEIQWFKTSKNKNGFRTLYATVNSYNLSIKKCDMTLYNKRGYRKKGHNPTYVVTMYNSTNNYSIQYYADCVDEAKQYANNYWYGNGDD